MSLSLNKPKLDNLAGDIWKSAERLRGKFKAYEYQGVILPIIVIRRLECVLLAWRGEKRTEVLAKRSKINEKELAKLVKGMETGTAPFSNKTDWTLRRVYEEDHALLEANFRACINGFSKNVDDIIEHFNYLHFSRREARGDEAPRSQHRNPNRHAHRLPQVADPRVRHRPEADFRGGFGAQRVVRKHRTTEPWNVREDRPIENVRKGRPAISCRPGQHEQEPPTLNTEDAP
jgi:hypothetical protein